MITERSELFKRHDLDLDLYAVANQFITELNILISLGLGQQVADPGIRVLSQLDLKGLKPVFDSAVHTTEVSVAITSTDRQNTNDTAGIDIMAKLEKVLINQIISTTQQRINDGVAAGATEFRVAFPIKNISIISSPSEDSKEPGVRLLARFVMSVQ